MSTRYASLGTGIRRSPKTSVIQPWYRRAQWTHVNAALQSASYPATAHTKGNWAQVIASTAANSSYLSFASGNVSASATDTSTLIDIGIGAAGAETVIVPDIAIGGWSFGRVSLPVAIPSGARVAIRIQGTRTTGSIVNNSIVLLDSLDYALTPQSVDILGVTTGTSSGTALSGASGTWVQIAASTAKDYQQVVIVPSTSSTDTAAINVVYTLGVGAAGSEVAIGSYGSRYTANEQWSPESVSGIPGFASLCGPVPAGSRLSIKHNIASNPDRYNVCLIGIPYV